MRFIFDTGDSGGPGLPGGDVFVGIDQAMTKAALSIKYSIKDDLGDKAKARQLAEEAAKDPNVVAVVGHLSSSVMAETLKIYADHGVPVIMPVPTNPSLTSLDHRNIIRLPPTDKQQAAEAADFISANPNVKRIAVVRDADNPIYSQYLAAKFISNIRESYFKKSAGPVVAYEATLGLGMSGGFLPIVLKQLNIDTVFFAGSTENAITLLELIAASDQNPIVLMTDGVVDAKFLRKLSKVPDKLFVTFQLGKDGHTNATSRKATNQGCADRFTEFELSFCPYGYDSVQIVRLILQKVLNGSQPQEITREAILNYFRLLKSGREVLHGEFNDYRFDARGDNIQFGFSVWKADNETHKFKYFPWRTGG